MGRLERTFLGVALSLLASSTPLVADDDAAGRQGPQDLFELSLEELGEVRVTTASMLEEPLAEVPVPVTVITAEMIHDSGARSFADLLTLFVPGMTFVQDHNEVNVAMRGVYTSSQQKMLLLLDGHRMNSRAYSSANPDHGIGLEKIEQIEVLRGPGSSLYGNVALTAVINIVPKRGAELEGGELTLDVGDYGERRLALTWGRALGGPEDDGGRSGDILFWYEGYVSDGEPYSIAPENDYARAPIDGPIEIRLDAFDDQPSFDVGLKLAWGNFELLANRRSSHYAEPFSGGNLTGEAYVYDDYLQIDGIGPGLQSASTHLELAWDQILGERWSWRNSLTWDTNDLEGTVILVPATQSFVRIAWFDDGYGLTSTLNRRVKRGDLVLGYQFDNFRVYDSDAPFGVGSRELGELFTDENPVLANGSEHTHSIFGQLKRRLGERWLLNVGARFDRKKRKGGRHIEAFSPRLALIYGAGERHRFKLSFASSFVDPPYWNRFSAFPTFRGSVDLEPEHLDSLQLTHSTELGRWRLSTNVFFNHMSDVIFRNNNATAEEPIFTNAGHLDVVGLEHEASWTGTATTLRFNATGQWVTDEERVNARSDEIFNIPTVSANLSLDHRFRHFSAHLALRFVGDRSSPISINLDGQAIPDPFPDAGVVFDDPRNRLGSATLVDLGFSVPFSRPFEGSLELRTTNLLDHRWDQGGSTLHPYPRPGRRTFARLRLRW